MDRVDIGTAGLIIALLLLAVRVPISVALGIVSLGGIWALTNIDVAWGIVSAIPYTFVADWNLSAAPMFLLMGFVAAQTGLTRGLFANMRTLLARVPGGLASATVVASGLFASASGSSVATAAAFSRIAVPEMRRAGYQSSLATGSVAAAGTLGALIPPSILMILYGVFTETSIGDLFVGGIIPGILTAAMYIAMITVRVRLKSSLAPPVEADMRKGDGASALWEIWPLPVLILSVIGGIFAGVVTPTEAGAAGAAVAVLIAVVRGTFSFSALWRSLVDTAVGSGSLLIIVIAAAMFSVFIGLSGLPAALADSVLSVIESPLVLILAVAMLFIVFGMFVDSISVMILALPVVQPILEALNIDMVWFGIILVKLLEIGMITPPVGLNVFVIKSSLGNQVELTDIFKGTSWFILMDLVTLSLLILFPVLSLFLPSLIDR